MISATLALNLPRDAASVPLTRRILDAALSSLGVIEDCRDDVQLALSEACTNAVLHAQASLNFQVLVTFDEEQCVIEVVDDGPGIEPGDGGSPAGATDVSGRGLRIIQLVADRVEVEQRQAGGTLLRFAKRLRWSKDTPAGGQTAPHDRTGDDPREP